MSRNAASNILGFGSKKSSNNKEIAIKVAGLDALTTNVMLADDDYNIIYVNKVLMAFLKEVES
ncbi:MAG: hypothetical protein ACPGRX_04055, partial [Bdellovibrionales bacterium]